MFNPLFQFVHLIFIHDNGPRSAFTFKQGHALTIKGAVFTEQVGKPLDLFIRVSKGCFQIPQGFIRMIQFSIRQSTGKERSTPVMVERDRSGQVMYCITEVAFFEMSIPR